MKKPSHNLLNHLRLNASELIKRLDLCLCFRLVDMVFSHGDDVTERGGGLHCVEGSSVIDCSSRVEITIP